MNRIFPFSCSPNKKQKTEENSVSEDDVEIKQEVEQSPTKPQVTLDIEPVLDEDIIYDGEIKREPLLEFHRKVSRKPTSWEGLLERIKEGDQRFKCIECGKTYVKIASFVCHALKHTGEKSYLCRLSGCTSSFSNWRALETHLIFHCDERKYVCEICGFTCKHRNGYYKHKQVHEKNAEQSKRGPKKCLSVEKFRKLIKHKVDKEEEELIHEEAQDIDLLEEEYFEKANPTYAELLDFHKYQQHKKSKTWVQFTEVLKEGDSRYRCTVCGKEYRQRKDHIYHVLSHTGERPMSCRVVGCTASFRNWKKLKDHLVGHCDE